MAMTLKEKRIRREIARLRKIFESLDPNKLQIVEPLIERAAYITVTLQEVEDQLNREGWVEKYQNGKNQSGLKKSAAAEVHISLTKNLNAIMKQLLDLAPPAKQTESKLAAMMNS